MKWLFNWFVESSQFTKNDAFFSNCQTDSCISRILEAGNFDYIKFDRNWKIFNNGQFQKFLFQGTLEMKYVNEMDTKKAKIFGQIFLGNKIREIDFMCLIIHWSIS